MNSILTFESSVIGNTGFPMGILILPWFTYFITNMALLHNANSIKTDVVISSLWDSFGFDIRYGARPGLCSPLALPVYLHVWCHEYFYFVACSIKERIHVKFVTEDAVAWHELAAATSINWASLLLVWTLIMCHWEHGKTFHDTTQQKNIGTCHLVPIFFYYVQWWRIFLRYGVPG